MGHKHDPNKACTGAEMCRCLEDPAISPGLIEVRHHGGTQTFKGPKGVVTLSDRGQLDPHTRSRIIKLAIAAGIMLGLLAYFL